MLWLRTNISTDGWLMSRSGTLPSRSTGLPTLDQYRLHTALAFHSKSKPQASASNSIQNAKTRDSVCNGGITHGSSIASASSWVKCRSCRLRLARWHSTAGQKHTMVGLRYCPVQFQCKLLGSARPPRRDNYGITKERTRHRRHLLQSFSLQRIHFVSNPYRRG